MKTYTEADVISAVTLMLGNPSLSELSLASKTDALKRALIEYSKYRPLKRIGVFSTVATVQRYDIGSAYTYLLGITDVFYGAIGTDTSGFVGNFYPPVIDDSDLDSVSNESLRNIDNRMISVVQAAKRYDHEMLDENIVALMPVPDDERNVYFNYTLIKQFSDLRENEYQTIVDFTFLISAIDLANKRHKILQVNEPGTGFVMFQGGRFLAEQEEKVRKRLEQQLGVLTLIRHG